MNNILKKIILQNNFLKEESFSRAVSGTVHEVFLSKSYVIRIRKSKTDILPRESALLRKLDHSLIPRVLGEGEIDGCTYAIENRLNGVTVDTVWKKLSGSAKTKLIYDIISFLKYSRTQKAESVYSIKTGKKYESFYSYLTDGVDEKMKIVSKHERTSAALREMKCIIFSDSVKRLFEVSEITLTHGDLVFHNLLTDKDQLTGVLDWELSFYGDPEYDILRLMHFKCSAKIYQDQGCDDDFEFDYLEDLLTGIFGSGLINYGTKEFKMKYEITKSLYYLNALYWAASSKDPEKNVSDVLDQWQQCE